MAKKLTPEEVDSELKLHNLTRIDEYKNIDQSIKCVDKEGYVVWPNIYNLRSGHAPQKFGTSNPNTIDNIKLWIRLNNKRVTLIEGQEYKHNLSPLNVRCDKCSEIYDTSWGNFQSGNGCPYCYNKRIGNNNNLAKIMPELIKYFEDPEIPHRIALNSTRKESLVCPDCGHKKYMTAHGLYRSGFSCEYCSDGISIPEKFVRNILKNLGVNFETQFRPSWSLGCRYDFYIESLNLIIETHGMQHYNISRRGRNLRSEQDNDAKKESLAAKNGLEYLVIDCRKSTLEWLSKNCSEQLSPYFDLTSINFLEIYNYCQNSCCVESWKLWNEGLRSTSEISKKLGVSTCTVITYLKRGAEIKKVNYDPKEQIILGVKNFLSKTINQYSLSGEFIRRWESSSEAGRQLKACPSSISSCVRGKRKSVAGFIWRNATDELSIKPVPRKDNFKPINQYSLSGELIKKWGSRKEAAKMTGVVPENISMCAKGKRNHAGGFIWRYLDGHL